MKKLILTLALLTGVLLSAQEMRPRMHKQKHSDLTAEQMAVLKTKRMALALDLTDSQQRQVQKLNLEQQELRKSRRAEMKARREGNDEKPVSTEERYEHELDRLNSMIAFKAQMKSILNQSQYEKWERMQMHRKKNSRSKRHGHRRMGR
ncbi:hypothetical protein [Lentiprolixibacter aurantiacus]|uniref:LTXXQ motif family protein n=1 Tax=Lentiprolixibacter aurantiacus TaxID=2993939 RepID=A0AAE3SLY6_9FLAO|nr:hypothetical protein [Lentiprolixibacter aurantiacus]MCX2717989.1 hypothetical protein [Lentiprolixibacter aurantiacus]